MKFVWSNKNTERVMIKSQKSLMSKQKAEISFDLMSFTEMETNVKCIFALDNLIGNFSFWNVMLVINNWIYNMFNIKYE